MATLGYVFGTLVQRRKAAAQTKCCYGYKETCLVPKWPSMSWEK